MNSNLTIDLPSYVSHLECGLTGEHYPANQLHGLSRAGKPLLVRYDLARLKASLDKHQLSNRSSDLWRYREFLPVTKRENIVSLGECLTPIIELSSLSSGRGSVFVKDEGRLPTGSFKARGLCLAVSMAKE